MSAISRGWDTSANVPGVMTASLLVVLLSSPFTGAYTGWALGRLFEPALLAVVAGLAGTVLAGIVRNTLLVRLWQAGGVDDVGTPVAVIIYAAIASLAGSLSAVQLMGQAAASAWPGVLGALAGLLSAVLMSILIVTYRMQPRLQT